MMRAARRLRTGAIITVGFGVCGAASIAGAQSIGDFKKVEVQDIAAPATPAFVLLGVSPASVQYAKSPQAVTSSLISLPSGNNAAIEIAPYWLQSQPGFEFEDWYAHGALSDVVMRSILATSAFSIGTTPKLKGKDTVGTAFGLGYSVMLWPGRMPVELDSLKKRMVTELGKCSDVTDVAKCLTALRPLHDSLKAHTTPTGFKMQFAGGGTAQFPHDSIKGGAMKGGGVWLTPSYTLESRVDLIGVARYLVTKSDTAGIASTNALDWGGRIRWKLSDTFVTSFEALTRNLSGGGTSSSSTQRYGGVVEFRATDDMYVEYAIGQDFAASKVKTSPLFASLGFHLGFGKKPVLSM